MVMKVKAFRLHQEAKLASVIHLHLVYRRDYLSEIAANWAAKMDLNAITPSKAKEGSALLMQVAIVVLANESLMIVHYGDL